MFVLPLCLWHKKKFPLCLFSSVFGHSHFLSFLNICFSLVSPFLLSFFGCISFLKILFDLTVLLLPFIFSFYIPSCHSKNHVFLNNVRFCCPFFTKKERNGVFSYFLFSPLHYEKIFIENLCWLLLKLPHVFFFYSSLSLHLHQCNTFPFWTSAFPFNSLLLFILYPLVLFFGLFLFSRFFHLSLPF